MRKPKKAVDPRLDLVVRCIDEIGDYNSMYDDSSSPSFMDLALEMISVAIKGKGSVEIARIEKVLALLWADNDEEHYSDEEERREAMYAIAQRAHRITCKCCRQRHNQAVTT